MPGNKKNFISECWKGCILKEKYLCLDCIAVVSRESNQWPTLSGIHTKLGISKHCSR